MGEEFYGYTTGFGMGKDFQDVEFPEATFLVIVTTVVNLFCLRPSSLYVL